jgi:hypothetical protein
MPSLIDPYAKLDRANIHLDALKDGMQSWANSKPKHHKVTGDEDLERSEYVMRFTNIPQDVPLPLAMIAGDFIACVRASLDHVAWQLAASTVSDPSPNIAFPICGVDNLDTHTLIAKATFQLPDTAVHIIKSLQPYKSGKSYKSTHLWRLNKLWNIDKHRHLLLHSETDDVGLSFTLPPELRPLETITLNDGLIMRFPIAAKPYLNLDPPIRTRMTFGDAGEGIELDLSDLREIYEFVRMDVIPRFSGFFA